MQEMERKTIECEWVHLGYGVVLGHGNCVIEARETKLRLAHTGATAPAGKLPVSQECSFLLSDRFHCCLYIIVWDEKEFIAFRRFVGLYDQSTNVLIPKKPMRQYLGVRIACCILVLDPQFAIFQMPGDIGGISEETSCVTTESTNNESCAPRFKL